MKRYYYAFVLLISVIFVNCSSDTVTITSFSPQGKIEKLTNFTIEFSHDLAPMDSIGVWSETQFISFTPAVSGKFKWENTRTLVFSTETALAPIQGYTAKVSKAVLFGKDLSTDFEEYKFNSPDFEVEAVDLFWTNIEHKEYKLTVQANIKFNYPVNPKKLADALEVKSDGKTIVDFEIITSENSNIIAVNFGEVSQKEKEQKFSIKVKKNLNCIYGKKSLSDDREFNSVLPPITKLVITDVTSGVDGETGWIEIYTTQKVDETVLSKFISFNPKTKFEAFVNENSIRLEISQINVQTVTMLIKEGLPGLYGGKLGSDFEQEVNLLNVNPSLKFTDKNGIYLLRGGSQNLEISAVNIDEIEVDYAQIYDNNLVHFFNRNSYRNYYYDDYYEDEYDYYYDDYYYERNRNYNIGDYGKEIFTEKIKVSNKNNLLNKIKLDIKDKLDKKFKGIYVVTVRSNDERYITDSKIISLSNLGIIAKVMDNEILIFVNEINSTESVSNAKVKIISTNNQIMYESTTDNNGVASFKDDKKSEKGFYPSLIIVEKDDDYNFLDLSSTKVGTSRYDVGGLSTPEKDYKVFLYGPRELYRPGDDVNVCGIVRNDKIAVVRDIPVLIKVISPTGKEFDEFKKDLDNQGSFDLSFNLPVFAQTGNYNVNVYTGSDVLIGSYDFNVEEFVPDKIRVNVASDKKEYKTGEHINISIDAEYLYGAKASNLNFQSELSFKQMPYSSKKYPEYSFSRSSLKASNLSSTFNDGVLDNNGSGSVEYIVPGDIKSAGYVNGTAIINVFDPTGRTVTRWADFKVYTRDYFIGIKSSGYYYNVNDNLNFNLVAVDHKDETLKKFNAVAKLVRLEWQTVLKKDNSDRYYYASEEKAFDEWEKKIVIDGKTPLNFKLNRSGKFELRIYKTGEEDYQKQEFYAYGWGSSTTSSFKVDREGRIEIITDKKEYQPGETAKVLFTCPFSGKMLVTMERNNVLDYQYVEVKNKSAELNIKMTNDFMPNIYITATLFKKHSADQESPFFVGHGFQSVKVVKKENKLNVSISAPEKIKPNTTQTITIKTNAAKDTRITLAAVDEGVLQITNYKTPSPFDFMYAKRPLEVNGYDLYELLLPEFKKNSSTGGDGGEDETQKRINPITVKRFKLLSFWSGIKKTDGNGNIKVSLNIPQFNGNVRLMAVAFSNSNFGSAERSMLVADDIIIEPQIPRTLAQYDKLVSPVTLINTTDKEKNITVTMKVSGSLKSNSQSEQKIKIRPKSSSVAIFSLEATSQVGASKIYFTVTGDANAKEEIEIAVKPISPLIVESDGGIIKANESTKINIPSDFIPNSQKTTLTLSKFPAIKYAKQLKELIGYPHGCIEQTVSKLFPQLYFEDIAKLVAPEFYKTTNPVYYVKEGIKKIESMQMYDGSMSYWQGGNYSNWWGSVYAAHFLVEAKKAKYNVSEYTLNRLLEYLSKKAKEPNTYNYVTYSGDGKRTIVNIANKEILYSLYVLALAKQPDLSTMNYYKGRLSLLSEDSKYFLAGAFALIGRWNSYYDIMPKAYEPIHPERLTGESFDSDIRGNALMLNVLLDIEPGNKQIPLIVKYLTKNIENCYSTQDQSFTFLALGKAAKNISNSKLDVDVIVKGKSIGKYSNKDLILSDDRMNASEILVKAKGNGQIYFFWSTEGVKQNIKVKEEDSHLRVRREYYNYKTKQLISNNTFKQGDLVVCRIALYGMERNADNIAITDIIPAGFEIENPRLNSKADVEWKSDSPLNINYMDIRDDRILLFTNIIMNKKNEFYYLLRAVTQGTYQLPVIGAEAMYDREFHSYHGAGIVNIIAR
ncbi:MAG: MG2 domain-containing protein [Ignavibacteriaceae bacterium]